MEMELELELELGLEVALELGLALASAEDAAVEEERGVLLMLTVMEGVTAEEEFLHILADGAWPPPPPLTIDGLRVCQESPGRE